MYFDAVAVISRIAYLEWAISTFAKARYNLAVSGVTPVTLEELAGFGASPGLEAPDAVTLFRRGLSERYGVAEELILPALGTSGALYVVLASLVRFGDAVLVEAPAYEPLYQIAAGLGARVDRFQREVSEGFALSIPRVLSALRPDTRVVVLSNPHNPSGVRDEDELLRDLSQRLAARDVVLIVDEVYRELSLEGSTARNLDANIVAISSLTKCFGLGFARSGWMLGPREVVERAFIVTMHMVGEFPRMSAAVGVAGLSVAQALLGRARFKQEERRDCVRAFLERNRERLRWVEPAAGSVFGFFVDTRGKSTEEALLRGLETHGVLAVPGSFFGIPDGFRLSWTLPSEHLDEGLRHLEHVLELR